MAISLMIACLYVKKYVKHSNYLNLFCCCQTHIFKYETKYYFVREALFDQATTNTRYLHDPI